MTVLELINELAKYPPYWKIYVLSDENAADFYPDVNDYDWLEANHIEEDCFSRQIFINHSSR